MRNCAVVLTMLAGAAIAFPQAPAPAPPAGLGTIRLGASDNLWFGWRVGIPSAAFKQLTFSEALVHADTLLVTCVEASSTQTVSPEVPKMLDYRGRRTVLRLL